MPTKRQNKKNKFKKQYFSAISKKWKSSSNIKIRKELNITIITHKNFGVQL
jgi:hypothetical protein